MFNFFKICRTFYYGNLLSYIVFLHIKFLKPASAAELYLGTSKDIFQNIAFKQQISGIKNEVLTCS